MGPIGASLREAAQGLAAEEIQDLIYHAQLDPLSSYYRKCVFLLLLSFAFYSVISSCFFALGVRVGSCNLNAYYKLGIGEPRVLTLHGYHRV